MENKVFTFTEDELTQAFAEATARNEIVGKHPELILFVPILMIEIFEILDERSNKGHETKGYRN